MLQHSPVARWVPRYFNGRLAASSKRSSAMASHKTRSLGLSNPNTSASSGSDAVLPVTTSSSRLSNVGNTTLVPSATIAVRASAILDRLRKAEDTLVANRRIGFVPLLDSSEQRESIYYVAKTEVLSVLKNLLPPASPRTIKAAFTVENNMDTVHSSMERGKGTKHKFIPVPDEAVNNASEYVRRLHMPIAEVVPPCSTFPNHGNHVALSMNDIAIILQIYEAVECDDGYLLLQIMAELERLVINDNKENTEDKAIAIPQLLLALSSLGIVEEHVLQKLTNIKELFFAPAKLSRFNESELVRLIVALHRFGLHNQPCFRVITKILRHRVQRNPIKSFVKKTLFTNTTDVVPTCMCGLTVNNVLEALCAMALSLHRNADVVNFLVATMVAAVINEDSVPYSMDDRRFRTLQVHRAAKVCELMELVHPVLANLVHTRSTRYGGLFVDGGKDKMDSERVGFYDYVTADLVKANRG